MFLKESLKNGMIKINYYTPKFIMHMSASFELDLQILTNPVAQPVQPKISKNIFLIFFVLFVFLFFLKK